MPQPEGAKDLAGQKCIQGCILHLLCGQVARFPVGHRHLDHHIRGVEQGSMAEANKGKGGGGKVAGGKWDWKVSSTWPVCITLDATQT